MYGRSFWQPPPGPLFTGFNHTFLDLLSYRYRRPIPGKGRAAFDVVGDRCFHIRFWYLFRSLDNTFWEHSVSEQGVVRCRRYTWRISPGTGIGVPPFKPA